MGKGCDGGAKDSSSSKGDHGAAACRDPLHLVSKGKYLSKNDGPEGGVSAFGSRCVLRAARVKHSSSTKKRGDGNESGASSARPRKEPGRSGTRGNGFKGQLGSVARVDVMVKEDIGHEVIAAASAGDRRVKQHQGEVGQVA